MPTQRRHPGVSLRKIAPIITKKGISSCMIKAVADALRPERPENVRLYCKVADMNEIINRLVSWFLVGVINQTRTAAVTVKRNAISKIGGKCEMAAFAKTKPSPHTKATPSPSAMSNNLEFIQHCTLLI